MDGILVINKPKGFTSHDVVNVIKKTLNEQKVGHAGTLDPNATGVLPILIGKATKISKYLIEHNKEYVATIKLGKKTDTGDSEGSIIEEDSRLTQIIEHIEYDQVKNILESFIGEQKQIPPKYSAIKINGKKSYEYARKGQEVILEPRDINIFNIELISQNQDEITFKVLCSKGTYIRVLCEDIAKKIGTVGYMKELERVKINNFNIENSITIDDIKNNLNDIENKLISIEEIFKDKNRIDLNNRKKELFLNGVMLTYELPSDIYRIYNNNEFVGLGTINNYLLKRDVVIL